MINPVKFIILFFLIFSCERSSAQAGADTDLFPGSYIGNWKGTSRYFTEKGLKRIDSSGLKIQPVSGKTNEFTWQFLVYEEGHPNDRIFILRPAGDSTNHWLLDEQDGIIFDCYAFGSSLNCVFRLKGDTWYMNFKTYEGKMFTDFSTTDQDVQNQTGKGTDKVPFANSYPVKKFETGILEKQP